jgi:hypothetical protein
MTPATTADDGGEQETEFEPEHTQTTRRGREQTVWTIHNSPVVETTDGPFGGTECRWTLRVYQDGVVVTSRTIPYDGQRYYSTEDRPNRADKSSQYKLSVEEVIERHAQACIEAGEIVHDDEREGYVAALRERVLAVLWRNDVATNGRACDLLAEVRGE